VVEDLAMGAVDGIIVIRFQRKVERRNVNWSMPVQTSKMIRIQKMTRPPRNILVLRD
jgi:hypothetical protein